MANTSNAIFKNLKAEDTLISSVNFDGLLTNKHAAAVISSALRRSYPNSWSFTSNDDISHLDEFFLIFIRIENDINLWRVELRDDDGEIIASQTFKSNDLTAESFSDNGPFDVPLQFVFTLNDNKTVIATSIDDSVQNPITYLNRSVGGSISGNVEVYNHDFKVLSGNYIQTSTPLNVDNYSAANGFMQTESIKYGNPAVGSKAYCILRNC